VANWYSIQNNTEDSTASVFVNGEIGMFGVTAPEFIDEVKSLGVKKINVRINSGGGEVFEALAIANFMRNSDIKFDTYIESLAGSAATIIALAGDMVNISPNAFFFIHNPSAGAGGESRDLREAADSLDKIRDAILNTYMSKTGLAAELLIKMMNEETLLSAQEAFGLKFVDRILTQESPKIAASTDFSKFGNNYGKSLQNKIKLKMENEELKQEFSVIKNMLDGIKNLLPGSDSKTEQPKFDTTEIDNKIEAVHNKVVAAEAENTKLEAKNSALEAEVEELKKSNEAVTAELAALQDEKNREQEEKTQTEESEEKALQDEAEKTPTMFDGILKDIKNKYK